MIFLISFASETNMVDERTEIILKLIISHLTIARKRLDVTVLVASLSKREKVVADWLINGKTSWEISQILDISESTVKYHINNIFKKN